MTINNGTDIQRTKRPTNNSAAPPASVKITIHDTLISKGLPDELLDKAKEKFIEIQAAYEEIEKKNKLN